MSLDTTPIPPIDAPAEHLEHTAGRPAGAASERHDSARLTGRALLLALPGLALLVLHALSLRPAFIDDAFIFYRYAANWASGLGPVFNVGERVEGYSSLLWTALLAFGAWLGIGPDQLGPLLSLIFAAVLLIAVARMAVELFPRSTLLGVALPLGCALSTGYAFYSLSGMDTAIFAACIGYAVLAVRSALRDGRARGAAAALAALVVVRAEGLAYAVVMLALMAVFARRSPRAGASRAVPWAAGATLAAAAIQFLGRYGFYGSWLPASMSSKAYASHVLVQMVAGAPGAAQELVRALVRGARYVAFVLPWLALPVVTLVVRRARREPVDPMVWCLAGMVAVSVSVTLWAGGDWMPYHRHAVAVWCPVLVLSAWAAKSLLEPGGSGTRAPWPTVAPVLLLLAAGLYAGGGRSLAAPALVAAPSEDGAEAAMRELGEGLASVGGPAVVATNIAGKWPYVAGPGVHVRDILGLTDPHNARYGTIWVPHYGRTDPDYSYGPPLDLLVTNTTGDLRGLLAHASWGSRAADFVLFERPEWLRNRLFVAAPAGQPLAERVAAICGCTLGRLDGSAIARLRALEMADRGP